MTKSMSAKRKIIVFQPADFVAIMNKFFSHHQSDIVIKSEKASVMDGILLLLLLYLVETMDVMNFQGNL